MALSAPQTTVAQLHDMRERREPLTLLDVREPWEIAVAQVPGSVNIPLQQIPGRLKELDATSAIIVMCKVGARSQMTVNFLLSQGFSRVSNLQGGIDAWSREIDPNVPNY